MKKILVFICLMFLSSPVFSFTLQVNTYNQMREDSNENEYLDMFLKGQVDGTYGGLLGMLLLSLGNTQKYGTKSNVELWCPPRKIGLNVQNIFEIIDKELDREDSFYNDDYPIAIVLYKGLLNTFPCE